MKKKFTQLAVLALFFAFLAPVAVQAQAKTAVIYFSATGSTEQVATEVQKALKAEIFKIEVEKPYPTDDKQLRDAVAAEQKDKKWPAIKKSAFDVSKYDILVIGSPVWNSSVSSPVVSFLNATDLGGKKVYLFGTCSGGEGAFFDDFEKLLKNGKLQTQVAGKVTKKGTAFQNVKSDKKIGDKIGAWVKTIK
ncbi:MAG: NAD(P)H-dependent oxidoreductase [Spirochaetaceae bacterium]|jgi:flavodoxin|nr:NAD(P)H-dependent oxidoreductase [Spirochaetaceae bacterium]